MFNGSDDVALGRAGNSTTLDNSIDQSPPPRAVAAGGRIPHLGGRLRGAPLPSRAAACAALYQKELEVSTGPQGLI
jgi:hypothetical protein